MGEQIILHQRFSVATISLLQNYSLLEPKQHQTNGHYFTDMSNDDMTQMVEISGAHLKPSAHYFITKSDSNVEHAVFKIVKKRHETTNDNQIKRHYNNPFANITVDIIERKIKIKNSKILITNTIYRKNRNFNSKYFRTTIQRSTLTFDKHKGNFVIINYFKSNGAKPKVVFTTNSFKALSNILMEVPGIFKLTKRISFTNKKISAKCQEEINDDVFFKAISDSIGINFDLKSLRRYDSFYHNIIKEFVKLKNIKIPDGEYSHLLKSYYPTEKYLKKNDRKLIASVLDKIGIKSKFLIKILHDYRDIDLLSVMSFSILFGENYINYLANLNYDNFKNSKYINADVFQGNIERYKKDFKLKVAELHIYDEEKENILKCLNDKDFNKGLSHEIVNDIYDHFKMVNIIRKIDSSIRIRANSYTNFMSEHSQLSKMVSSIKKGWVIEYIFDEKMIEEIEKPINSYCDCDNLENKTITVLYPYILKREEDYIEEGNFMHHCVASYVDTDKSIIISLRTKDDSNRVTSEFKIQDGFCVQSRHFCNGQVPPEFVDALDELKDKVSLHARWGLLNWKEKKRVPVKINGIEIIPEKREPTAIGDLL